MRVVISDLLTGDCEMTGRAGVEVVRVQLDEATPEVLITTKELAKLLRLKKRQEPVSPSKPQEKKGTTP
jgi:hypothetical protein